MRKLLTLLPLLLASVSCSTFTWQGQRGIPDDGQKNSLKDVATLTREYETRTYWQQVRARRDGRVNAIGRDLSAIQDAIDRYVFNYSPSDASVNYATDSTVPEHLGEFVITSIAR